MSEQPEPNQTMGRLARLIIRAEFTDGDAHEIVMGPVSSMTVQPELAEGRDNDGWVTLQPTGIKVVTVTGRVMDRDR